MFPTVRLLLMQGLDEHCRCPCDLVVKTMSLTAFRDYPKPQMLWKFSVCSSFCLFVSPNNILSASII